MSGRAAKLIAFAGSLRTESHNKKLVKIAAEGARKAGAEVTFIDLRDFDLPIYDEDIEKRGTPDGAKRLKAAFMAADGFIISSPEYNSSVSGALKNAIDWASRPAPGEKSLVAFAGKTAVLMAASPGALGGLRGLVHLRSILGNISVIVLPEQMAISKAHEALTPEGVLADAAQQQKIEGLGEKLARFTSKLLV